MNDRKPNLTKIGRLSSCFFSLNFLFRKIIESDDDDPVVSWLAEEGDCSAYGDLENSGLYLRIPKDIKNSQ